ncbi:MAG: NFACT family protein [Candidatus Zixiibacteriota bacterium]|nr:MAG: NFACT family protein [candidate division Zixibacteria bacterium]
MVINSTLIFCLIPELKRIFLGTKIAGIHASPDQKELLFHLRGRDRVADLYFSAHSEDCRIEVRDEDEEGGREYFQKTNLFRSVVGGHVQHMSQVDFDRVIKISCEKKTQFGAGESLDLIFELTGRYSNVILVKGSQRIVDCLRKIDTTRSSFRHILPGGTYLPLPSSGKRNPQSIRKEKFVELIRASRAAARERLVSGFMGVDRLLADKIVIQADLDSESRASDLTKDEIERLWEAFSKTLGNISGHDLSIQLILDADGYPEAISCLDLPFVPDHQKIAFDSLNSAIRAFFSLKLEREKREKEIRSLTRIVQRGLKRLRHRAGKIEDDRAQAQRSEEYKRFGELLMLNKANIKKGQSSVRLTDVFDPESPEIEVPLDLKRTATRNAQVYFKKYKKARDALSIIEKRRSETEDQVAQLEQIREQLDLPDENADLEAIRRSLTQLGFLREPKPRVTRRKRKETLGRIFLAKSGAEILVGRNNKENDYLTFKFARPDDMWFHAQDVPGSHVLLRKKQKKTELSQPEIREAAQVAAHFSKARGEKKVAVVYTKAKYVRKPKKGKPGLALVEREKNIVVEPGLPGG